MQKRRGSQCRVPADGSARISAFQSYLEGALEIFGIEADETERAVMAGIWSIYEPAMELLRDADLGGVRARAQRRPLRRPRAMSDLDLAAARAGSRRSPPASSIPGELLDACLARIEERNPDLNAVIATFPDSRGGCSSEAPEGPLRGVPVLIKDEWPLPWRAETFGAASARRQAVPGESGPYRALRDAGAVIAGVAQHARAGIEQHRQHLGLRADPQPLGPRALSRRLLERPAAAVAGGLVSGAVGADGLGSIRYPAAYCGLTGLKPTFGRSAMEGHHISEHRDDRLGPALPGRGRLPPARLGPVRGGPAGRRERERPADRRDPGPLLG